MYSNETTDVHKCYQALATAIVVRACVDYISLKKCIDETKDGSYKDRLEKSLKELENFFRSGWFVCLSDMDGEWLMQKLDEGYEEMRRTGDFKPLYQFHLDTIDA